VTLPGCWVAERRMAVEERVGFEPTEASTSAVFRTAAISHSTTSPRAQLTNF
jgi:hypothetical protein